MAPLVEVRAQLVRELPGGAVRAGLGGADDGGDEVGAFVLQPRQRLLPPRERAASGAGPLQPDLRGVPVRGGGVGVPQEPGEQPLQGLGALGGAALGAGPLGGVLAQQVVRPVAARTRRLDQMRHVQRPQQPGGLPLAGVQQGGRGGHGDLRPGGHPQQPEEPPRPGGQGVV